MKPIMLTGIILIILFFSCEKGNDNDLVIKKALNKSLIPLDRDVRWNYVEHRKTGYQNKWDLNILGQYYLDGDTVNNNVSYKKLWLAEERNWVDSVGGVSDYLYNKRYLGGIRQDTGTTKVYFFVEDKEVILYDFKIKMNDTVNTWLTRYYDLSVVNRVDSLEINNEYRNTFNILSDGTYETIEIIEGIGNTKDGLTNFAYWENLEFLACFKIDGVVVYEPIKGKSKDIKEIMDN